MEILPMKIMFTPSDSAESITLRGVKFPAGEVVDVTDSLLAEKVSRLPYFTVPTVETEPPVGPKQKPTNRGA